jgi:hypothetical protein
MLLMMRLAAAGVVRDWRHARLRFSAIVVVSVIGAISVCAVLSATRLVERHNERSGGVPIVLADEFSDRDVFIEHDKDFWRGKRIQVIWIEPVGSGRDSILPHGLTRLPRPGEAFVSPSLHALAKENPSLADRFKVMTTMPRQALGSATQLTALIRPPAGRRIGGESRAVHMSDGRVVGQGPAVRVSSFGDRPNLFVNEPLPVADISLGLTALVGVPLMILLAVALNTGSPSRQRMLQTLGFVGIGRGRLAGIGAIEALILALPGVAVGSTGWLVALRDARHVPLIGTAVLPGDMTPQLTSVAGGATALLILTMATAWLSTWVKTRVEVGRPRSAGAKPRRYPWWLLLAGAVALKFAWVAGPYSLTLEQAAKLTLLVATPLSLASVLHAVAGQISRLPGPALYLASRQIQWHPGRAAQPFWGISAVLILSVIVAGMIGINRNSESVAAARPASIWVEWRDVQSGDYEKLAGRLQQGETILVAATTGNDDRAHGHDHQHVPQLTLLAACIDLQPVFTTSICSAEDPYKLSNEGQRLVEMAVSRARQEPVSVQLARRSRAVEPTGQAVALSSDPLTSADEEVRAAARQVLPAPYIESMVYLTHPNVSPLLPWLIAASLIALVLLLTATIIMMVDRLLAWPREQHYLSAIGIAGRSLRRVLMSSYLVPYLGAVAFTLLVSLFLIHHERSLHTTAISLSVLGLSTVLTIVGTLPGIFVGLSNVDRATEAGAD